MSLARKGSQIFRLGGHILAVFGPPVAQEDHAHGAVLAALDLQHRTRKGYKVGSAPQDDALNLRIGLATGQVAFRGLGEASSGPLRVVGETVMGSFALQVQAGPRHDAVQWRLDKA